MKHRLLSSLAALALGLALATPGCEDENGGSPCSSTHSGGIIRGRVITGGVSVTARVYAEDCASRSIRFSTEIDSTNAFHLDLPAGSYWLSAQTDYAHQTFYYNPTGAPYGYDARDSVCVPAGSTATADFLLGSLRIEVAFPPTAEGSVATFYGHRVTGYVDPQGCPESYDFDEGVVVTGGSAAISLGGLAPGPLLVQMNVENRNDGVLVEQSLWLPACRNCAEAETIQVVPGTTTHCQAAIAGDPAHVTGSILGSWRQLIGISGQPKITLVTADSSAVVASIRTRSDGTFESDILVPEPVRALIEIGDSPRWYPRGSFQESAVIELAPGASAPPIEVEESGLILDISYPLHYPSWDAEVQLLSPEQARVVATLEADAAYGQPFHAFPNLDPGDYWLRVLPPQFLEESWRPQWFDRAPHQEGATLVHVPAGGGIARVNIVLETGGVINGRIWYENSPGTYGALIYLTQADDPAALARPRLVSGHVPRSYTLPGLPDGDYKIGVWPRRVGISNPEQPPEDTVWYPEATDWNVAQVITITDAAVISRIDFDLR